MMSILKKECTGDDIVIRILETSAFSFPKSFKKSNEDFFLSPKRTKDGYVVAIADGVGSYKGAKEASSAAISCVDELASEMDQVEIESVFSSAYRRVCSLFDINNDFENASTTLTVCHINDKGLTVGHVGDCRVYIKSGNKLKQITKDHTHYQQLLDENIYSKDEIERMVRKSAITNAISRKITFKVEETFIPKDELELDDNQLSIYLMSDGAYHFWEKRPQFSPNTMRSVSKFCTNFLRRIERNIPIDDYSMVGFTVEWND
ncbi:PP2C family protein-serine/threonine phosphatase [Oceanospirillum sediminis]|uniref:PP2C family protein-serine/threonine phosphatase n=1 Tax=Oceanospirillum sediminis TaxID=2760088 RepID=UPI001C72191B|nr:protein phosphatase 2C domain-containing protein [Oceanospirillum sediminis]